MIINYQNIPKVKIDNMRGGEGFVYIQKLTTENYLMARITIPQFSSIGLHTHVDDNEYIYVEKGRGECLINDKWLPLNKGNSYLTSKGSSHSIRNNFCEDLIIIAYIYK